MSMRHQSESRCPGVIQGDLGMHLDDADALALRIGGLCPWYQGEIQNIAPPFPKLSERVIISMHHQGECKRPEGIQVGLYMCIGPSIDLTLVI